MSRRDTGVLMGIIQSTIPGYMACIGGEIGQSLLATVSSTGRRESIAIVHIKCKYNTPQFIYGVVSKGGSSRACTSEYSGKILEYLLHSKFE